MARPILIAKALDVVLAATRMIPPGFAFWAGGVLGWWFGHLPMRDQRRARANLRRAFPERDEAWIERTTRHCFRHFGRMALWSMATVTLPPRRLLRTMVIEGREHFMDLMRASHRGQGTVLFTGHYGNWELMARAGAQYLPLSVIGKRLRNAQLDALVVRIRASGGARVLYQDEDVRTLVRELRRGRVLCTLADQDIPRMTGIHVPWFGVPAHTPVAPAALVMLGSGQVQAAFCFAYGGRWVMHLSPRRHIPRGSDRQASIRAITTWITAYEEALVRRHPEQWVWWHMRWRTQPPAAAPLPAVAPDGAAAR